ncbi:PQ-loop domain-containing transporter [Cryptosporangium aurantiacum]|uniref:PQ loop repeat-containing protein n=1 Tax=Cryptosporangium aurantiacum TaxID=134849 RepID=A0A1M7TVL9_9ACTN|nr:PQ-loop domain-containing transporter [Cryptosporangium aurantiacum]SHN74772.1 PQ loop repeat-containing protein [Cryptosporangium aurantiacum]
MDFVLDALPLVAAVLATPQYVPQIRRLHRTGDTAGVSWAWAALTSLHNTAWFAYFTLSGYWSAMVPSSAAALLAGVVAVMLARRGCGSVRTATLVGAWAATLGAAYVVAGRAGLGGLLTAAAIVQLAPPLRAAYRTARPTGIAAGTWVLLFAELSCWLAFGLHRSDPRLVILGATGVTASTLILARVAHAGRGFSRLGTRPARGG